MKIVLLKRLRFNWLSIPLQPGSTEEVEKGEQRACLPSLSPHSPFTRRSLSSTRSPPPAEVKRDNVAKRDFSVLL